VQESFFDGSQEFTAFHPGLIPGVDHDGAATPQAGFIQLSPGNIAEIAWMPSSCAYRLLHEGKDLYWWHPLVSGNPETVHLAQISVRGKVISEDEAGTEQEDLERHIVDWAL
jgi:hypothetical protein